MEGSGRHGPLQHGYPWGQFVGDALPAAPAHNEGAHVQVVSSAQGLQRTPGEDPDAGGVTQERSGVKGDP